MWLSVFFEASKTGQNYTQMSRDMTKPKSDCVPSGGSDQPGHPHSLISFRCPHEESLGP